MERSTREDLLRRAKSLFASRGFYGTSLANIADAEGVSKQALLHHFQSKGRLYGEVLAAIAQHYDSLAEDVSRTHGRPAQWLVAFLHRLYEDAKRDPERAQLLTRELLDNPSRAEYAHRWALEPFLKRLADAVGQLPGAASLSEGEALAQVYPLLGALQYGVLSQPTLKAILPSQEFRAFNLSQERALEAILSRALEPLTLPVPKATEPANPATMRTFPDKP